MTASFVDQNFVGCVVIHWITVYVPSDLRIWSSGDSAIKPGHFSFGHIAITASANEIWRKYFASIWSFLRVGSKGRDDFFGRLGGGNWRVIDLII